MKMSTRLPAIYQSGPHTFTKDQIGTRYIIAGVRTLVDPNDPSDMKRGHALQDAIKVEQLGGPGSLKCPNGTRPAKRKCVTR